MIGYRDMTFCSQSECARFGKDCHRSLTDEVKRQAEQWWGGPDAPMYAYAPSEKPECFEEKKEV